MSAEGTDTTPQQESLLIDEAGDEDQYNFSYKQRGQMVLIVNEKFKKSSDQRVGADRDLEYVQEIAKKLGFQIFNEKNSDLTQTETEAVLDKAQQHDHSDCDCFMFVVSSHGEVKVNPRTGRTEHVFKCSDDQFIFTSSVLDVFSDTNCPTLKNKPKMFFIQACRGEKLDHGVEVKVVKEATEDNKEDTIPTDQQESAAASLEQSEQRIDSPDAKGSKDSGRLVHDPHKEASKPDPEETPSFELDNYDFLVMSASAVGHLAYRNDTSGSWLLNSLNKTMMSYDTEKPEDFLLLLTQVTGSVARRQAFIPGHRQDKAMAVPVIKHTLLKSIAFETKAFMKGPV